MEPVSMTLGAIAAAVFAKAQERAAERTVEGSETVLRRIVSRLKASCSAARDEAASSALELVERAPDSPLSVHALANALDDRAASDAEFRAELVAIVEDARRDPVAGSFVTEVYGNAQVGTIVNIHQAGDVSL